MTYIFSIFAFPRSEILRRIARCDRLFDGGEGSEVGVGAVAKDDVHILHIRLSQKRDLEKNCEV